MISGSSSSITKHDSEVEMSSKREKVEAGETTRGGSDGLSRGNLRTGYLNAQISKLRWARRASKRNEVEGRRPLRMARVSSSSGEEAHRKSSSRRGGGTARTSNQGLRKQSQGTEQLKERSVEQMNETS